MKREADAKQWLRRAKSNLVRAETKENDYVFLEDLCFDAQQCVEKSLKSFCIFNSIVFPKTHDLAYLIGLIENNGIQIPSNIKKAEDLTDYSVETRYPGDYPEIDINEYNKVINIAKDVFEWVCKQTNIRI